MDYTLSFNIDALGPTITGVVVYQNNVTANSIVDVSSNNANLTAGMQYIQFNLADSGTPTTGVNKSYFQVRLTVNKTFSILLTYQNGQLTTDKSAYKGNFTFVPDNSSIIIGWNSTNMEAYEITKTYDQQNISVTWQVVTLRDNYGNDLSSNMNTANFNVMVEALPPPPDYLGMLIQFGAIFLVFIGIGVGAAYLYEKIRYIG